MLLNQERKLLTNRDILSRTFSARMASNIYTISSLGASKTNKGVLLLQGSPGSKGVEGTEGNQVSEVSSKTFEIHKQVKTCDIMFRRFSGLMMPLSRNE